MKLRLPAPRISVIAAPIVVIAVLFLGWRILFGGPDSNDEYVLYTVSKTNLPIVITERGNLESQTSTRIKCEVENVSSSRNGQSGTQIIYIVENGSPVKEGDLLFELDSAPIRELLDEQAITFERAKADQIQRQAQYDNQISQNETMIANAELEIELAQLELDMFMDAENGTHRLNVDEIARTIDQTNSDVLEAQGRLKLSKNELDGVEALFKLGYKGKTEVDEKRLAYLQAEGNLAVALNRLETQQATMRKLNAYEKRMSELQLNGNLANAQRGRDQVAVDNVSELTQAQAALDAANRSLEKEEERLVKLETQVERCKVYAPHDGMVVFERDRDFTVEEGAFVRERQSILKLPDLSKMQVRTHVHESVLDQVQPGLPVTVRVDAFADRAYEAVVESVAVVPAYRGWSGGDVKMYETVIRVIDEVEQLKPGMTAVVEINVDRLEDVMAVPVQAIVQRKRQSRCFVYSGGGRLESRELELGQTNDKFVHVLSGLELGDRVVLNPLAVMTEDDDVFGEEEEGEEGSEETQDVAKQPSDKEVASTAGRDSKNKVASRQSSP